MPVLRFQSEKYLLYSDIYRVTEPSYSDKLRVAGLAHSDILRVLTPIASLQCSRFLARLKNVMKQHKPYIFTFHSCEI